LSLAKLGTALLREYRYRRRGQLTLRVTHAVHVCSQVTAASQDRCRKPRRARSEISPGRSGYAAKALSASAAARPLAPA
jgi:hypothetical protein